MNKIPIFEWFYEQGDVLLTVLIKGATADNLVIPQQFHTNETETFVVGMSPTPNLICNDEGITAPMRFGGNFFKCFFGWETVIMMAGQTAIMQFAVNEEGKLESTQESTEVKDKNEHTLNKIGLVKEKKPHLKVVK